MTDAEIEDYRQDHLGSNVEEPDSSPLGRGLGKVAMVVAATIIAGGGWAIYLALHK